MIGKVTAISGKKIEVELEEPFNQEYLELLANGEENYVEVTALDNRGISAKQNALSHALIADVARWQGEYPYWSKIDLKYYYEALSGVWFEHHKATKSDAKKWIDFLIEFVISNNVPLPKVYNYLLDENSWFYQCLKYRRCCICMEQADIAHVDAVGMGRNRRKINHSDFRFMALCRCHHTEQHTIGLTEFFKKYRIILVKLNDEERKKLRIGG